ncbi:acetyl/propionyl/methylcrotonyl-CoA carboxylase subunit alpha [Pseudonocardia acaciae]|uniref:acetyl/propionyl/methylcrotonyl-CoA carboxylase subunit alpha n=1 Tax=Pseudonocardia acaciae TaxID=551276 RepID=UPI000A413756|nr:acetyl-CoA carboxylase biotin carboxylase subunit [Pseudonocardia acaciae]
MLVANRGEIAVRIMRTCAELGIASVAVHSPSDADALHVRLADEAVPLGDDPPSQSYLNVDKIIDAAKATGVRAVHPGYGFLAENAEFARAVEHAGLTFVGPPPSAIEAMGDKIAARRIATDARVPLAPGTVEPVTTADQVRAFGAEHGYPIAVKASHGGGGRGMRIVESPAGADQGLEAARREAGAAFGDPEVYLERYLPAARHVEVQVLADAHGGLACLGDRDCSVQRRHQKLVEESPAPGLPAAVRTAMAEAALRLAGAVGYLGAGTVEYLLDGERFYFLEMNTRIQVEHPVTEAVLGVDLVAEQLRIAAGEPLLPTGSDLVPRGHAIECRINAEDPASGLFVPSPGRIERLHVPPNPGVRFDSGYRSGDEVPPHYDSMIGKLVVWAPDRETAIRRTLGALDELVVAGVPTTVPAARAVLAHPDFAAARMTTRWLESTVELPAGPEPEPEPEDRRTVWVAGRRYHVPYLGERPPPARADTARPPVDGPRRRPTRNATAATATGSLTSPMQGTVIAVNAAPGDVVTAGQVLFVVEAMKMENPVRATTDGVVGTVTVTVGDVVAAGAELAVLDRADTETEAVKEPT